MIKLGLQLGYWGSAPPSGTVELVAAAEQAGWDAIFTAEAWRSDAFTPLAWPGEGHEPAAAGHLDRADVRRTPPRSPCTP